MSRSTLALFDVDGTLTDPRRRVTLEMLDFLRDLRSHTPIALVGGSDLVKIKEQLGDNVLSLFDHVFAENGLDAYTNGSLICRQSIKDYLGEEKLKSFINVCLHMIADLDIPMKRGTFIEFRNGMLNISPIGRNCTLEERNAFEEYDRIHKVRQTMVDKLTSQFASYDLTFSIGGQISFDVFPRGWDKTFCLQYLTHYHTIHFFGDKTMPGGNDYEIYMHPRVIGHTVLGPMDTMEQCRTLNLLR